jgi:hypothetical protein
LIAALVITSLMGFVGLNTSLLMAKYLRGGVGTEILEATSQLNDLPNPMDRLLAIRELAVMHAMAEMPRAAFGISVAHILLAGLLMLASGLAMSGRRGGRELALQAITALAAFHVLEYLLTMPVRTIAIEAVARAGELLPDSVQEKVWAASRSAWWWVERAALGTKLAALGFAALALSRKRTLAFFEAAARAAESAEEEP